MKFSADIWHNILWSKYKGAVFSEVHRESIRRGINIRFFQIAETDNDRRGLSNVDLQYQQYPYELISKGSYDDIPVLRLIAALFLSAVRSPADVIVMAGYHRIEYWAQLIAARMVRKKVMVFCDSTYLDRRRQLIKDMLKRVFFSNCDGFFCYGQRSMEYLLTYGVPASKIFIRCQAAALPSGYNASDALEKRLAILRAEVPLTILYVGRLAPEKNLHLLLDAFGRLSTEMPECRLKLVGDGPERRALGEAVSRLGLSEKVIFAGSMSGDRLFDEYANAACLVLPSWSEPWGVVVNEALSYGCPVVVSDNCGCVPELVFEGATGFKFSTFDATELGNKLLRAISSVFNNEEAARACIRLMGNFTSASAAASILNGIESLLQNDRRDRRKGSGKSGLPPEK